MMAPDGPANDADELDDDDDDDESSSSQSRSQTADAMVRSHGGARSPCSVCDAPSQLRKGRTHRSRLIAAAAPPPPSPPGSTLTAAARGPVARRAHSCCTAVGSRLTCHRPARL
jgi:hypothetical protein